MRRVRKDNRRRNPQGPGQTRKLSFYKLNTFRALKLRVEMQKEVGQVFSVGGAGAFACRFSWYDRAGRRNRLPHLPTCERSSCGLSRPKRSVRNQARRPWPARGRRSGESEAWKG